MSQNRDKSLIPSIDDESGDLTTLKYYFVKKNTVSECQASDTAIEIEMQEQSAQDNEKHDFKNEDNSATELIKSVQKSNLESNVKQPVEHQIITDDIKEVVETTNEDEEIIESKSELIKKRMEHEDEDEEIMEAKSELIKKRIKHEDEDEEVMEAKSELIKKKMEQEDEHEDEDEDEEVEVVKTCPFNFLKCKKGLKKKNCLNVDNNLANKAVERQEQIVDSTTNDKSSSVSEPDSAVTKNAKKKGPKSKVNKNVKIAIEKDEDQKEPPKYPNARPSSKIWYNYLYAFVVIFVLVLAMWLFGNMIGNKLHQRNMNKKTKDK
ncbi:uncharacterized protein [Diabrotica undecimpunctata]|uniref:uncharacterized protein n=1 Tax=Diabrotica undecimpunctata TaxID=50387 RepID=UPI003B63751E